jgi:hypothetical protein
MFLWIVGWPSPDYMAPVKEIIILCFNLHATRFRYGTMKILIEMFGVAAPSCLVGRYRRFGQKSYFHLQGWSVWRDDLAQLCIDRLQGSSHSDQGEGVRKWKWCGTMGTIEKLHLPGGTEENIAISVRYHRIKEMKITVTWEVNACGLVGHAQRWNCLRPFSG